MWTCEQCGCMNIAGSLDFCPQCREEREMPKSTTGGASNGYETAAPELTETVEPEPEIAPEPDAEVEAAPEPEPPVSRFPGPRAAASAAAAAATAPTEE